MVLKLAISLKKSLGGYRRTTPAQQGKDLIAVAHQVGVRLDVVPEDGDGDALQVSASMATETGRCDDAISVMEVGELV